jgi:hypothetical protein
MGATAGGGANVDEIEERLLGPGQVAAALGAPEVAEQLGDKLVTRARRSRGGRPLDLPG